MNSDVRWLNAVEQATWRRLLCLHIGVLPAIDRDLKQRTGICLDDYSVLVLLSESPERRIRMSALAEQLSMQPSRLTYRIGQLERMGFVERVRSNEDGRSVFATLTESGAAQLAVVAPEHIDGVRNHLVDHFDPGEFEQLGALLALIPETALPVANFIGAIDESAIPRASPAST